MPSFPIPNGGMDFFYIDESATNNIFIMASVRIPVLRSVGGVAKIVWPEYYEKATAWRRELSKKHGLKFREELHGAHMLTGKALIHKANRILGKEESVTVYRDALTTLTFLPDSSVMAAASTSVSNLMGQTKMTATMTALLQRIRRQSDAENLCGLVFFDEGHDEYFHAFRKAQKYLPVGSQRGGWPEGPTQNRPLDMYFEDGNIKSSKYSYLVQIADLAAYAALQKIQFERGSLSTRRRGLSHHTLFDSIPVAKRNCAVQPARGDGIAMV